MGPGRGARECGRQLKGFCRRSRKCFLRHAFVCAVGRRCFGLSPVQAFSRGREGAAAAGIGNTVSQKLKWNMKLPTGEPFRWNMGPEFVWGGDMPANLNLQEIMTQNLITLDLTAEEWTAADEAITTLETIFAAKLRDLSIEERSEINKMGPKSEAFCRQSLVIGRQNVASLPAQTVTDLGVVEGDLSGLDKLRPRLARLTAITEKANDSEMALGSDIKVFCLSLYDVLKAIGQGAGLDTLRAEMKATYGTRKARSTTPPAA
jgi:hypothetical protein